MAVLASRSAMHRMRLRNAFRLHPLPMTQARLLHSAPRQWQQKQPQDPAPQEEHDPEPRKYSVKNYSGLRMPWLRVFLASLLTYQLCYWSWEKMRTDEIVEAKTAEVKELEKEIDAYKQSKAAGAK